MFFGGIGGKSCFQTQKVKLTSLTFWEGTAAMVPRQIPHEEELVGHSKKVSVPFSYFEHPLGINPSFFV